ncbi:MAG: chemotaxis protein CheW [Acidobacteriota bacterium]
MIKEALHGDLETSLQQLVVFRLADEEYGASVQQVKEVIVLPEVTPMPRIPEDIRGVINLRGQIIAVVDLSRRLGVIHGSVSEPEHVIIVELDKFTVGMIVDEVPEVIKLSEENIEQSPYLIQHSVDREYIVGVAKTGQRLIVVLDLLRVLSKGEISQLKAS